MKTSCQITKDLLPLVVDEIASDDTRTYVEDHLSSCPNCQKYHKLLRENTADIGRAVVEKEEQLFEKAAVAIRRKRAKRTAGKIILGILIAFVLLFVFYGLKSELYDNQTAVRMNKNDYDIRLSRLSDGRVVASVKLLGGHTIGGMSTYTSEETNGMLILHLELWTSLIPHGDENVNSYQHLMTLDLNDCDAVSIGNGEKTIWQRGEEIPAASQEMEIYLKKSRELQLVYAETDHATRIGYLMGPTGMTEAEQVAAQERAEKTRSLEEELECLLPNVQEWQTE